jgi:hypothetical protein
MQSQTFLTHGKAYARALRITTIAAMSASLLAGSAMCVAAQDGTSQLPDIFMWASPDLAANAAVEAPAVATDLALETPIFFTWENGDWPQFDPGTLDETTGVLTGRSGGEIPITASDPRFDSTAWVNINGQRELGSDSRAIVETRSYRLVDTLGCNWTGSSTAGVFTTQDPVMDRETAILSGDGPCEGLTMWTSGDYLRDGGGQAVIIRAQVPPVPDVPDADLALTQ